jgi:hypothetical protein
MLRVLKNYDSFKNSLWEYIHVFLIYTQDPSKVQNVHLICRHGYIQSAR